MVLEPSAHDYHMRIITSGPQTQLKIFCSGAAGLSSETWSEFPDTQQKGAAARTKSSRRAQSSESIMDAYRCAT
jgi:hypothetical protein